MQTCKNCGNNDVQDDSKYCNQCGAFLKLAKKPIQFKLNKHSQLTSLKKTLIEGSKIVNEDEDGELSSSAGRIKLYQSLLLSYLKETTNIEDILNNKINEKDFTLYILILLNNVKKQADEDILNEFLVKINEIYEISKSQNKIKRKFIFYTNIKLREFIKDKFCEMLEIFNLKAFNVDNYEFEIEEYKKFFKSDFILLEYTTKGKDINLMIKEATNRVYLFFGYLTYLHEMRKRTYKDSVNPLSLEYNLSDIDISAIIELNTDNTFIDEYESYLTITSAETYEKSKLIKFTNNNLQYDFYKILLKSENKQIINKINEYLILYYKASNERDLSISFLKFWILGEKIIKHGNERSDDYVLKYMRKILKHFNYPKSYQERIYYVKEKRNKLIHEHDNEITQDDRNVIKSVCDHLILFLMEFEEFVNNMDEYKIFLDYYNQDNSRLIEILNLIEDMKNLDP